MGQIGRDLTPALLIVSLAAVVLIQTQTDPADGVRLVYDVAVGCVWWLGDSFTAILAGDPINLPPFGLGIVLAVLLAFAAIQTVLIVPYMVLVGLYFLVTSVSNVVNDRSG